MTTDPFTPEVYEGELTILEETLIVPWPIRPMTEYALSFVTQADSILTVEKRKPDWQKFRINLPGGKLEEGETALDASIRELFEETGITTGEAKLLGVIEGPDYRVHCVRHYVAARSYVRPVQKTDEPVAFIKLVDLLANHRLIPNLRIIIPLMLANVAQWSLIPANKSPLDTEWTIQVQE